MIPKKQFESYPMLLIREKKMNKIQSFPFKTQAQWRNVEVNWKSKEKQTYCLNNQARLYKKIILKINGSSWARIKRHFKHRNSTWKYQLVHSGSKYKFYDWNVKEETMKTKFI